MPKRALVRGEETGACSRREIWKLQDVIIKGIRIIFDRTNITFSFFRRPRRRQWRTRTSVWWKDTSGSVVSGKTVDTGLDQNESELGVLVLSVSLKVLSHVDSLLDQVVEILWELWGKT